MKKFGHKYDGAQEQEQMLNMLNIGLGAFLLYLFHKNFGKKMSGGGPTDPTCIVNNRSYFGLVFLGLAITFLFFTLSGKNETLYTILMIIFLLLCFVWYGYMIKLENGPPNNGYFCKKLAPDNNNPDRNVI